MSATSWEAEREWQTAWERIDANHQRLLKEEAERLLKEQAEAKVYACSRSTEHIL